MKYQELIKEVEGVGKLKLSEQEKFYHDVLNESSNDLEVMVAAIFYLGMAYYYEGNFNKAKEIIEPIILQYQSMPFVRELISAFNLMGVMLYYDGANVSSRYYYEKALQIAMEHEDVGHYCYEYNNISITYVKQEKYEEALDSILKAKEFMPCCVEDMGAYVYLNLALIYNSLNQVDKALEAFNIGLDEHDGKHIILEDYLNCGIELFSKAGMHSELNRCADELEKRIETMYAVEYIDACIALFDYYLEQKMFDQVKAILRYMDSYMVKHPDEIRLGLMVESSRYKYGKVICDLDVIILALEKKNAYYERIFEEEQVRRCHDTERYFDMNRKLQLALENETKANQVKMRFLASMSHDIRTPINGILGMMQIIRKNWGDMDKLDDSLNKMEVLTKHLNELVEDVLNMSKLESDYMEIVNEPFDLNYMVEELNSLIDAQVSLQNITYHKHMENVVHTHLIGDALQLRRILVNLLTNAIKYNKPNGTIDAFVREVSSDDLQATFEFEIKDTGIGMSEDYIENHLFTPFSQAKQDARTRYEGTGLGMSIVKGLVDKLGGSIEVKSEVGVGTQIKVILAYQLDTSNTAKQDTSKLDLKDKRILLVEDNEINMEVAEFYLNAVHANVDKAWNGLEAVEKVKEQPNKYSLILMDIMMPKMNGDEAAKCIRKINPSIPIVAMSAQSEYSIDQTIMNDSISKPIDEQKLNHILSKYVS